MDSSISFSTELKNTLNYLIVNPKRQPTFPSVIPRSIIEEIRNYGRQWIKQEINTWDEVFDIHGNLIFESDLLSRYHGYIKAGVESLEDIRLLLLMHSGDWIGDINPHIASDIGRVWYLHELMREDIVIIDEREDKLLRYAQHNYLCHYSDGQWSLSSLGRTLLRLPELQATRFLLGIETYTYFEYKDPWRISPEVIQELLCDGKFTFTDEPWDTIGFIYEPGHRLVEMHLAEESGDSLILNSLGKQVIKSILAKDSYFDTLLPFFLREEIIGSEAPNFTTPDDRQRFYQLIESSPIAGELKKPILEEVDLLYQVDASYLSIFKALAPNIEGLLRNICVAETIEVKETGVNAYLKLIKKSKKPILKISTLEMIDSLFRPYRNVVEHGYFMPPEPARMMCELTLSIIEQIHRDYMDYKEVS